MIRSLFRFLFKCAVALGAVYLVWAVFKQLDPTRSSYIEIYNDEDGGEGDYIG